MTQSQEADYRRLLDRAILEGCAIAGKGTITKCIGGFIAGEPFHAVTSSKGDACYLVVRRGLQLVCNCPARGYCKHRAIVRHRLAVEATAAALAASIAAQDAARTAAIFHRNDSGPRIFR